VFDAAVRLNFMLELGTALGNRRPAELCLLGKMPARTEVAAKKIPLQGSFPDDSIEWLVHLLTS
jgi:hypothetical protein